MSSSETPTAIVATGATHYRLRYGAMALLCLALGGWFLYDGFYAWPRENRQVEQKNIQLRREGKQEEKIPHNQMSVLFNKLLGVVLPPVGVALIVLAMVRSRGEYRLEGQVLHVPGHGAVRFDQIRRIDKTRWNRKGIAVIHYETEDGQARQFTLDDWVFDRAPIDQMLQQIEAFVRQAAQSAPDDAAPEDAAPPPGGT